MMVAIFVHLDFKDHFKIPEIQCVNRSNIPSNPNMNFSNIFLPVMCSNFPNREESQGTMVKDAKSENPVAIITVTANCLMILETKSLLKEIGKNTTMITNVIANTVNPISEAPS